MTPESSSRLSRLLRARGYDVKPYSSPQVFLEEHDEAIPGCAILDVSMPDLDGLEIQDVLTTASGSHRPVVFVTGKGDIPTSVRAMKAGAIDFLTKPVKDQDLFEALSRAEAMDAELRRLRSELDVMQSEGKDLDPTRTRSAYACRGGAAQQADCRRSGYGRKDHQGPSQPDDGESLAFELSPTSCAWPRSSNLSK